MGYTIEKARLGLAVAFLFLLLLAWWSIAGRATSDRSGEVSKLYPTSRARLALARARGEKTFDLVIAAAPGRSSDVAEAILAVGGHIGFEANDVDYFRAAVPVDAVTAIAQRPDVTTIDADAEITVLMPSMPSVRSSHRSFIRSADDEAPLLHPYLVGNDLGTLRLRKLHPTFDGRGTTIALIDGTPDFLLPGLQIAERLDGSPTPKFVDIETSTDPDSTAGDSPWFSVPAIVRATGGIFTYKGVRYTAPHDGTFRFVIVRNLTAYQNCLARMLRANMPNKTIPRGAELFTVLWDLNDNVVWTTPAGYTNFKGEKSLRDYHIDRSYGTFPIITADPLARTSLGFVLQTDLADKKIALLFGGFGHGTMTAGTLAANRAGGGLVDGVAPGASIFAIAPSATSAGLIEAGIRAARDHRVDVVCFEVVSPPSYGWKDGRFTESVILARLTQRYKKNIVFAANNSFGLSRISEACIPDEIVCVGAYEGAQAYRINNHIIVPDRDNLHFVGAFGPGGNGALKPTFLAPSGFVSLFPAFYDRPEYGELKGEYHLRPGYGMGGGTSQATPTAAAAIAILLSAARQNNFEPSPQRLTSALTQTARYIENLQAYQEGNGLIRVDAAFAWLMQHRLEGLPGMKFIAPVRTTSSPYLHPPNTGPGLFLREGVSLKRPEIHTIWVEPVSSISAGKCSVSLRGNDGTFSTASSVMVQPGHRSSLPVRIDALKYGIHSALLKIACTHDTVFTGETLLTVVAGERFVLTRKATLVGNVIVPRPGVASLFFTVPQGARTLVMRMTSRRAHIVVFPLLPDATEALNISNNLITGLNTVDGTIQTVFPRPVPGTWEMQLSDYDDYYTGHPQPVVVTPTPVKIMLSLAYPAIFSRGVAQFATFTGILLPGQQRTYNINVPPHATGIGARLHTFQHALLHLYLFQCTPICEIKSKSTQQDENQSLYFDKPHPGVWKVVVDGYGAAQGGAPYRLRDYYVMRSKALGARNRTPVPVANLGILGNDPDIYYNEGPNAGTIPARKGLHAIIFDVRMAHDI